MVLEKCLFATYISALEEPRKVTHHVLSVANVKNLLQYSPTVTATPRVSHSHNISKFTIKNASFRKKKLPGFSGLGGIADIINGIIKKLLDSLTSVIPEPLTMPLLNISLPYENIANGSFVISDLVEIGARNFKSQVNASVLNSKLTVILDFPSININTNYFSDLLFGSILPMYGEGPANIRLKNLKVNLTSKYTLNILKLKMQIKNTSLLLNLDEATFDLHGMINNEAFSVLASQILDDTVSEFINKHNVLISKLVSPAIESVVNSIMNGGGKNKTADAVTPVKMDDMPVKLEDIPTKLDESRIVELRQLFVDELKKQPLISKYVSF